MSLTRPMTAVYEDQEDSDEATIYSSSSSSSQDSLQSFYNLEHEEVVNMADDEELEHHDQTDLSGKRSSIKPVRKVRFSLPSDEDDFVGAGDVYEDGSNSDYASEPYDDLAHLTQMAHAAQIARRGGRFSFLQVFQDSDGGVSLLDLAESTLLERSHKPHKFARTDKTFCASKGWNCKTCNKSRAH